MRNKWLAAPYVGWMALFVVAPLVLVVVYALTTESADGSWFITLDNFEGMMGYASVFGRSFLLAFVATIVCILVGYPLAYLLARERGRLRSMAMLLIMLPMWMNFLLRTYSWMFLLERNGFINNILGSLGFFNLLNAVNGALNGAFGLALPTDVAYIEFLGTQGAVVLGISVQEKAEALKQETDYQFCVPSITDFMLPSLSILPLQLFAYYVASMKGCDIDKPRNLAKSVTVE